MCSYLIQRLPVHHYETMLYITSISLDSSKNFVPMFVSPTNAINDDFIKVENDSKFSLGIKKKYTSFDFKIVFDESSNKYQLFYNNMHVYILKDQNITTYSQDDEFHFISTENNTFFQHPITLEKQSNEEVEAVQVEATQEVEAVQVEAVQVEATQEVEAVQVEAVQVEAVQVEATQEVEAVQVEAIQVEVVQVEATQVEATQVEKKKKGRKSKNNTDSSPISNTDSSPLIQETVVQKEAIQETVVQETVIQEEAVQETVIQEEAVQETVVQEEAVQETVVQEEAVQEEAVQEEIVEKEVIKTVGQVLRNSNLVLHEKEEIVVEETVQEEAIQEVVQEEVVQEEIIEKEVIKTVGQVLRNANLLFREKEEIAVEELVNNTQDEKKIENKIIQMPFIYQNKAYKTNVYMLNGIMEKNLQKIINENVPTENFIFKENNRNTYGLLIEDKKAYLVNVQHEKYLLLRVNQNTLLIQNLNTKKFQNVLINQNITLGKQTYILTNMINGTPLLLIPMNSTKVYDNKYGLNRTVFTPLLA